MGLRLFIFAGICLNVLVSTIANAETTYDPVFGTSPIPITDQELVEFSVYGASQSGTTQAKQGMYYFSEVLKANSRALEYGKYEEGVYTGEIYYSKKYEDMNFDEYSKSISKTLDMAGKRAADDINPQNLSNSGKVQFTKNMISILPTLIGPTGVVASAATQASVSFFTSLAQKSPAELSATPDAEILGHAVAIWAAIGRSDSPLAPHAAKALSYMDGLSPYDDLKKNQAVMGQLILDELIKSGANQEEVLSKIKKMQIQIAKINQASAKNIEQQKKDALKTLQEELNLKNERIQLERTRETYATAFATLQRFGKITKNPGLAHAAGSMVEITNAVFAMKDPQYKGKSGPSDPTKFFNSVDLALMVAGLLIGPGGPSSEEVMFGMLKQISKQIEDLHKDMNQQFGNLNFRIAELEKTIERLHSIEMESLNNLNMQVSDLRIEMYRSFQSLEDRLYKVEKLEVDNLLAKCFTKKLPIENCINDVANRYIQLNSRALKNEGESVNTSEKSLIADETAYNKLVEFIEHLYKLRKNEFKSEHVGRLRSLYADGQSLQTQYNTLILQETKDGNWQLNTGKVLKLISEIRTGYASKTNINENKIDSPTKNTPTIAEKIVAGETRNKVHTNKYFHYTVNQGLNQPKKSEFNSWVTNQLEGKTLKTCPGYDQRSEFKNTGYVQKDERFQFIENRAHYIDNAKYDVPRTVLEHIPNELYWLLQLAEPDTTEVIYDPSNELSFCIYEFDISNFTLERAHRYKPDLDFISFSYNITIQVNLTQKHSLISGMPLVPFDTKNPTRKLFKVKFTDNVSTVTHRNKYKKIAQNIIKNSIGPDSNVDTLYNTCKNQHNYDVYVSWISGLHASREHSRFGSDNNCAWIKKYGKSVTSISDVSYKILDYPKPDTVDVAPLKKITLKQKTELDSEEKKTRDYLKMSFYRLKESEIRKEAKERILVDIKQNESGLRIQKSYKELLYILDFGLRTNQELQSNLLEGLFAESGIPSIESSINLYFDTPGMTAPQLYDATLTHIQNAAQKLNKISYDQKYQDLKINNSLFLRQSMDTIGETIKDIELRNADHPQSALDTACGYIFGVLNMENKVCK